MAPFPLRNRPPSLPAATCPGTTRAIDVAPYNVIPARYLVLLNTTVDENISTVIYLFDSAHGTYILKYIW